MSCSLGARTGFKTGNKGRDVVPFQDIFGSGGVEPEFVLSCEIILTSELITRHVNRASRNVEEGKGFQSCRVPTARGSAEHRGALLEGRGSVGISTRT